MDATVNNYCGSSKPISVFFNQFSFSPTVTKKILLAGTISAIAVAIFVLFGSATSNPPLFSVLPIALCVMGGIVLASALYFRFKSSVSHEHSPLDGSMHKMLVNAKKALQEHLRKEPESYAPVEMALLEVNRLYGQNHVELTLSHSFAEAIGVRDSMEDAHFYTQIPAGTLFGVLDGHAGQDVAAYAAKKFAKGFTQNLTKNLSDPYKAFNATFTALQEHILKRDGIHKPDIWTMIGSTAVIAFVDRTNRIFTATLGDSELNIYRKNAVGQWKSIPLSCVRDWSSPTDALRASIALNKPELAKDWPAQAGKPRFPLPRYGLNVSRALGDAGLTRWPIDRKEEDEIKPGIIHKPKITVNQLQLGDILIAACDGLKDYVPEREILDKLAEHEHSFEQTAQSLVDYALGEKNSQDNVTVLAIQVNNNKGF